METVPSDVVARRGNDAAAFVAVDAGERVDQATHRPGAHLNEDQHPRRDRDEINLANAAAIIALDDRDPMAL